MKLNTSNVFAISNTIFQRQRGVCLRINRNLLKIAIICTALSDAGNGATSPALGTIAQALSDVEPALIQMISSITALFIALTPPFYAKAVLMGVKKRTLLGISAVLFLTGGMGPFFFNSSIWIILFFRALLGIASGISIPLSVDLVLDFFDGKERHTMTGFVSATVGISGILFQLLGGYLAGINWTYTFLSYGISIIFVLVWVIFLPEPSRAEKIAAEEKQGTVSTKLNGGVYLICTLFGLFYVLWYIVPNNGAIVLISESIAVPSQIGAIFSMITLGSFLMSLFFGQLFKVLKFVLFPIAFFSTALGLYLCYLSTTQIWFTVGIALTGMGMGIVVPTTMVKVTSMVSYAAAPKATSLAYFALGFGGFLQPIIFSFFGTNGVGRITFLYGTIAMAICGVLVIIANKITMGITTVYKIVPEEIA